MCGNKKDTYRNYKHLQKSEEEDTDYRVTVRPTKSPIVVLAPHGGGIEPHTSEIAREIAGTTHNLYLFEGIKKTGNCVLHIKSTNFDEPKGVALVESCELAVAVHGKSGADEFVEIGGANHDLASAVRQTLSEAGFDARQPSDPGLAGKKRRNICNRTSRQGVQLEMCRGLRDNLIDPENRGRLVKFVEVIRGAIERHASESGVQ